MYRIMLALKDTFSEVHSERGASSPLPFLGCSCGAEFFFSSERFSLELYNKRLNNATNNVNVAEEDDKKKKRRAKGRDNKEKKEKILMKMVA